MFKILNSGWSLLAVATTALLLSVTSASATPTLYNFDSGSVQLRAVNTRTQESVLSGPSVVTVPLGGTFVEFDPSTGTNGTILGLKFVPDGTFSLDLNPLQAVLDEITIANAMLINAPGATADVLADGSFNLDSEMSADVSGVFPDMTPFPSTPFTSQTSQASGNVFLDGLTLQLGLLGINIATFQSLPFEDPQNPGQLITDLIQVKADFFFVSTAVPEPGTALLMGLGLAGLASARGQRRD